MKSLRIRCCLLVLLAGFTLYPALSWSAMPAFMNVTGRVQGEILGSVEMHGREGTILVYSFGHNLRLPLDPNTGMPTGKRQHSPLEILKEFDRSSPKLYQAMITGEELTEVLIKFYRIDPAGAEEHYYTIKLENALIVRITPNFPSALDPDFERYKHMEIVAFYYQKITWRHEIYGTETVDYWLVPK